MKKITFFLPTFYFALLGHFFLNAQSTYWGMAPSGSTFNNGAIFKTDATGQNLQVQYSFPIATEGRKASSIHQASNGKFYGTTQEGGANDGGVLFEYDLATDTYTKLFDFDVFGGANGRIPEGSVVMANNGKLYGTTRSGGNSNWGVLFEYDLTTNSYSTKVHFESTQGGNGASPYGGLIEVTNGKLYGTTYSGGDNSRGVLFEYDYNTNTYTKKVNFNGTNGRNPIADLIKASNGKIYGTTGQGGTNNKGVLFEYDYNTDTYSKKVDFDGFGKGESPNGLYEGSNGKIYGGTTQGGILTFGTIFEYDYNTDVFTKKLNLGSNHEGPTGNLVQASNGHFYGMTYRGGNHGIGGIFEYNTSTNSITLKAHFNGLNGNAVTGDLVLGQNGKIYAVTPVGGDGYNDVGVFIEYDPINDTLTKYFDFDNSPWGKEPKGSLFQASNGLFYGMTYAGGRTTYGTLFEYNPITETYTKKIDLGDSVTNNAGLPRGELMEASNGKLYGVTETGGANGGGVLFEYDFSNNTFTLKASFDAFNTGNGVGYLPQGSLIEASNGKLYGLASYGGSHPTRSGTLFEFDRGTNTLSVKHSFSSTDGARPKGSLIQASNGKLYGVAEEGGQSGKGVLFEYDLTTNTYTKHIDFNGSANGETPVKRLIEINGKLYGVTERGGQNNRGIIFEFNINTNSFSTVHEFNATMDGIFPASVLGASNGKLYGMTSSGGNNSEGVLFEYALTTNTYSKQTELGAGNGSRPSGHLIEVFPTGTNLANLNVNPSSIKLYPNPSSKEINLEVTNNKIESITLVNAMGQVLAIYNNNFASINVSQLTKGIYFLEIQTTQGMISKRFVRE